LSVKDDLEKLQQEVSALDAEWKEVWQQFQENDQRQQAAFNVSPCKYFLLKCFGSLINPFYCNRDSQLPILLVDYERLRWSVTICPSQ
jgi:hypothetical protein